MGIELAKAFIRVRADSSRLRGDLNKVTKQTGSAIGAIGMQLRGMMAGLGLVSLGASFAAAAREAATFEDTMIFVRANARLLGKEGAAAFRRMEDAVRKMGATTRFTAVNAAEAMNQLVLGGLAAEDAIGALPSVLNLAASSGMGLAESAKVIVDNMIKYNMAAKDTGIIADFLSSAQSRAQITARDLAGAHQTLGAIAAEMGASFLDVTAILTAMGKSGTDMNSAGTALAMALARLTAEGGPAAKVLKDMGVEMSDFTKPGGGIDMIPMFRAIADAMPEDPIKRGAKAIELFGIKGKSMLGIFGLMRRGKFVEETAKGLENDIGRAAKVAAARMDTFIGILLKAKSALSDFAITALTPVLKGLRPLIGLITKMTGIMSFATQQFFNLDKALGGMLSKTIIATTAVLALVKAIQLIGPAAKLASIAIRMATLATGWFALVAVIGTAIAGLITLVQWLWKTDAVQEAVAATAAKFGLAWERVKQAFKLAAEIIIAGINSIGKFLQELTGVSIPQLAGSIEDMARQAIQFIANFVVNATEWLVAILTNWKDIFGAFPEVAAVALSFVLDMIKNATKLIPQLYGFALRKSFDAFLWFAGVVLKLIRQMFISLVNLLSRIPELIITAIQGGDVSGTIIDEITGAFKGLGKGLKGEFPDISKIFIPSERTKRLMEDEVGAVFDKIAATKRELELTRGLGLQPLEDPIAAAEAQGDALGKAAAKPLIDLEGRLGFRELGKSVQDAMLGGKDDKGVKDDKRNALLELGIKRQDELIKITKEGHSFGELTGGD